MSFETEIQTLLDKQAIAELIYLYASAIDRSDGDLLGGLFTEDAMLDYGFYTAPAQSLAAGLRKGGPRPYAMTHHQVGNVLVRFEGEDQATAVTFLSAIHRAIRPAGAVDEMVRARYFDRLVKRGDAWLFAERRLVFDWSHVFPADDTNWWERPDASGETGSASPSDPTSSFLAGFQR